MRSVAERVATNKNKGMAHHEYFNKDKLLGMEGITVYFKPKGGNECETHVYSILSTEKEQDGNVVYANTRNMLEHLLQHLDRKSEIVDMIPYKPLLELLEDTDGCGVQYRCANSMFMVHKLSTEINIIVDRVIDAEGHAKKSIDGFSGFDKTYLRCKFRTNVEYQPGAVDPRKRSVSLCQIEDGKIKI